MNCPKCGNNTKVREVSYLFSENETYRKHECEKCGYKFVTVEFEIDVNEKFIEVNEKELNRKISKAGLY